MTTIEYLFRDTPSNQTDSTSTQSVQNLSKQTDNGSKM